MGPIPLCLIEWKVSVIRRIQVWFRTVVGAAAYRGRFVGWNVEAAVAAKIGFATHQNAIPIIRDLKVAAPPEGEGADDLVLTLSADPPFVQTKAWRIDRMSPGDELDVADRDVALNATLLLDLTESMSQPYLISKSR
jgi:hypothetical protein